MEKIKALNIAFGLLISTFDYVNNISLITGNKQSNKDSKLNEIYELCKKGQLLSSLEDKTEVIRKINEIINTNERFEKGGETI
jgi:hypothetical protein